jgi:hypothetical protein
MHWWVVSRTRKTTRTEVKGKNLSLTSKQITKQNYVIQKQEHKN